MNPKIKNLFTIVLFSAASVTLLFALPHPHHTGLSRKRPSCSSILLDTIEEKPRELMITSMVRAHMCRQLAGEMHQKNPDQFFTAGLLSLVDAVTDRPMTDILKTLPLIDDIKNAISQRQGAMGVARNCVEAYERCDWEHTSCGDLDESRIRQAYLSSIGWARALTEKVLAES